MKLNMYSIFDNAAKAFVQPFYTTNDATAIRSFTQAANDQQHAFHLNAHDYTLFHLGSFDQDRGTHTLLPSAVSLGNASQFKTSQHVVDADAVEETN